MTGEESPDGTISKSPDLRYQGASWYGKNKDILVVGAGGYGSYLISNLVGLGHNVLVYDHDRVELHNTGTQFQPLDAIGKSKVEVSRNLCQMLYGKKPHTFFMEWKSNGGFMHNYVFSAADKMSVRKDLFRKWVALGPGVRKLFVDCRLDAERFELFIVPGSSVEAINWYSTTLYSDEEVEPSRCTYQQTRFMASMAATNAVNVLCNFIACDENGLVDTLPRKIVFDGPLFMYTVE